MDALTATAVVLSAAALTGIAHTIQSLRGSRLPGAIIWAHGSSALASLALLAFVSLRRPSVLILAATIVAYVAGIGGMFMYLQRRKQKPINVGAVILHAPFELIAVALCWMAVFDAH